MLVAGVASAAFAEPVRTPTSVSPVAAVSACEEACYDRASDRAQALCERWSREDRLERKIRAECFREGLALREQCLQSCKKP